MKLPLDDMSYMAKDRTVPRRAGVCPHGLLVGIKDAFGNITRICYNAFNAPVTVTDANGIVTDYSYNDAGCVTRIVCRDGSEVRPAGVLQQWCDERGQYLLGKDLKLELVGHVNESTSETVNLRYRRGYFE